MSHQWPDQPLQRRRPVLGIVLAIVVVAVVLGAVVAGALAYRAQAREITTLKATVTSQAKQEAKQQRVMGAEIIHLEATSGSAPSDPLSAYDQICNQQLQNSVTGNEQTYYYPCTNSAQTIPQPGN
jgi:hypothetical protein